MPDLGFSLDGLYAAGWWPSDGDRCLLTDEARWYPDEQLIFDAFAHAGITPEIRPGDLKRVSGVVWTSPTSGRHTVIAQSRIEALILAYTVLLRERSCESVIS